MSNTPDTQKTLEVKIRPYSGPNNQERPDQKGVSRVHMCKESLMDLRIDAGQPIYIWKNGQTQNERREAIAWPTAEKSLSKKVVQMSKTFQEICDCKLGDDLNICAAGPLREAESIVLRDLTAEELDTVLELGDEDKSHWVWFLRESLARAEIIFTGMTFKNLSLRGPKRSFTVDSVNGNPNSQARYEESSSVTISSPVDINTPAQTNGHRAALQVVDVAGIDQAMKKLNRFLSNFDRQFKFTSAQRSCAVLLHGGHGTGKTFLLNKVARTGWGRVFRIERHFKASVIRSTFKDARTSQPSIIVIDELERMVSKDDSISEEVAMVLGDELHNLADGSSESLPRILVIAATLDAGSIPISLRKRGRFFTDIPLPIPDARARKAILKSLSFPLHPDTRNEALEKLGDRTHAYTAEDLLSLLDTACEIAEEKADSSGEGKDQGDYYIAEEDVEQALLLIRPTAMHDITLRPPSVRWDEIGGQESVKKALRRAVETPLLHPERMQRLGASPKKGLLLYGPPGCSKTLSAQAMATESGFNFFAVKGAELLNMYVGESERAVRDIFARARAASPSVIFFDEIESIGSKREGSSRNSSVNVLTTLLNEMDGIETLKGVTVLAATNRPQVLDLALIRPGRFDQLIYVPPPDLAGREAILRVKQRKMDMGDDVDIPELAKLTEGYSGAELVGICQAACDEVLEKCETAGQELQLHMDDFLSAIKVARKGIAPEMIYGYERWAAVARGYV
ncbi:AAA family ATPase-like protein [Venustampulla echinocandica]|uniref:AAA family ATPase-like protein n=1 Tax=Venustampulla echinocandica TaxID=2656787 RepID=A0A370TBJ5_9HELO|nr:AAA family ATPase-like protein [Venustampulla echinocandica]RDL31428.1 AAA family ATPase-like protein [Venustampulla echinocandica]